MVMAYKEVVGLVFLLFVDATAINCLYSVYNIGSKTRTYEYKYCYKCCQTDCCADTGTSETSDIGPIIGAVCGSVLMGIIIFTVLCCVYIRVKRARNYPTSIPPTAAVSVVSSGQSGLVLQSTHNQPIQMKPTIDGDGHQRNNKVLLMVIKAPRSTQSSQTTSPM